MPYAFEGSKKASLLPAVDKRVKLAEEDKRRIRWLWDRGSTIRAIAREYKDKCSRRLIQFVIFPDRLERTAWLFAQRRADGRYYKKERHTKYMRKHRKRKHKLLSQTMEGSC